MKRETRVSCGVELGDRGSEHFSLQPVSLFTFHVSRISLMPLIKTIAITLNSRKWSDADRIVTFYTKERGKVRAIARGARRMKSRLGASDRKSVV